MNDKQQYLDVGNWSVIVPDGRMDEAKAILTDQDEYDTTRAIQSAFRDAGFEIKDEN